MTGPRGCGHCVAALHKRTARARGVERLLESTGGQGHAGRRREAAGPEDTWRDGTEPGSSGRRDRHQTGLPEGCTLRVRWRRGLFLVKPLPGWWLTTVSRGLTHLCMLTSSSQGDFRPAGGWVRAPRRCHLFRHCLQTQSHPEALRVGTWTYET